MAIVISYDSLRVNKSDSSQKDTADVDFKWNGLININVMILGVVFPSLIKGHKLFNKTISKKISAKMLLAGL